MGQAAIDSHSQKTHTKNHKISKLGVNQASFEIQPFNNVKINPKEMSGYPNTESRMAINFFVNFEVFKWLYLADCWVYLYYLH